MDLSTARARIHAMLPILDNPTEADARETEMGHRIDDLVKAAQAETSENPLGADFFQPGRTYLRFVGDRELYFRVTSISTDNPNRSDSLTGDGPVAHGWVRTERFATVWGPGGYTDFAGWHDVTSEPA